jgi:glycosidase
MRAASQRLPMATCIETIIERLYGQPAALTLCGKLRELIQRHHARRASGATQPRPALTERDALLITYADQVREASVAPLRTLAGFLDARLKGAVSGVHILPFYPSSSDDGFAVQDFFAVSPELGDWYDVGRLCRSFDLMFDGVFNHVSARGVWFKRFIEGDPVYRDFFISVDGDPDLSGVVRPRALPLLTRFSTAGGERKVWTTFSADQVDLNFKNPAVLLAVLEALLFYVERGARFVRLDAIAYLWKEPGTPCIHLPQTHQVIQIMRAVLDECAPNVLLITETNVPHADNVSYFGDGSNEAQLVYNFALPPLVLHSVATGDARKLSRWAASLSMPSDRVTFFNFLASHDGIGLNAARGILSEAEIDALVRHARDHGGFVSLKQNADGSQSPYELNINYFDALSDPGNRAEPIETQVDRFMAAQAVMLALAGVPGIYFHSLFGSRNDRTGADSTGIPRRINRQKFAREDLDRALADPASLRTRVFTRYRQLLAIRQSQPAFAPAASQRILDLDPRVFALLREAADGRGRVLCLHNVAGEAVDLALTSPGPRASGLWRNLFDGKLLSVGATGALAARLSPYEVIWAHKE